MKMTGVVIFLLKVVCFVAIFFGTLTAVAAIGMWHSLNEEEAAIFKKNGAVSDSERSEETVLESPEETKYMTCLEPEEITDEVVEVTPDLVTDKTTHVDTTITTVKDTYGYEAYKYTYFKVPLSESLQDHIRETCEDYGIDMSIVMAMIERESDFRTDCMGDKGNSYGLMQINKKWHVERMKKLGCDDLLDPYQNVLVGIDFLAELSNRKEAKEHGIKWVLMAYNGGASYANRLWKEGKVSKYALGVIDMSDNFETYTVYAYVD